MKKTVSVNIKGMNFLIEEDAYELLQDYLDRLNVALANEDGSKEIIEDVELRIAEICASKLNDSKTVIELAEIEEILEALGDPSQYIEDDESNTTFEESTTKEKVEIRERRLFRDAEDGMLGGVCSGIANYFNIDVVIIRAIFVILTLFGAIGIPLYLILWLIVPKAESSIDRLRMKGRPITVETVKEEVSNATERLRSESRSFANKMRHNESYKNRINRGTRILMSIIGAFAILFGLGLLIAFLIFVVGGIEVVPVFGDLGYISLTQLAELGLSTSADVSLGWTGVLMSAIGIIGFCLLLGTLLIFNIRNRWTRMSLLGTIGVTVIGWVLIGTVAIRSGQDNTVYIESDRTFEPLQTDELVIIPVIEERSLENGNRVYGDGGEGFFGLDGDKIFKQGIDVYYYPSRDSLFHIKKEVCAQGRNAKKAEDRIGNVTHNTRLQGDSLFVDIKYMFPKEDKLRGQNVNLIIEVPEGKTIKCNGKIIHFGGHNPDGENDIDSYYREEGYLRSNGHYDHWYYD